VLSPEHKSLFETFLQKYQAISGIINTLPFHPHFRDKVVHYFDTGFLWAREAMNILKLAQNVMEEKQPQPEVVQPESVQLEEKQTAA